MSDPALKSKSAESKPPFVPSSEWHAGPIGRFRYGLLAAVVLAQAVTLWISWPLWQVRTEPMLNLPLFDLPQVSFGWLLLLSLAAVMAMPRYGVGLHIVILGISFLFDQFRLQPQFIGLAVLMLATLGERGEQFARWHLTAMWFWAGMHKFLSPDWFGYRSWDLLIYANMPPEQDYMLFAASVVIVELVLAVMAIVRPRFAAGLCVLVHVGIALMMSPLIMDRNGSVIPWNLCIALVGGWLFFKMNKTTGPADHTERVIALALMIIPIGFYFSLVDRCFCHVLYSGNLPQAVITTKAVDSFGQPITREVQGWGALEVPFPKDRRLLKQYFEMTAEEGDRLHIYEPRPPLDDQYFVLRGSVPQPIDRSEFFKIDDQGRYGVGVDNRRSLFVLQRNNARVLRRSETGPVYAVAVEPGDYHADLMPIIGALPNLEQVQLSGCPVTDDDLMHLANLRQLSGIGLENTQVTDRGLASLSHLPLLKSIFHQGSGITTKGLENEGFNDQGIKQ